MTETGGNGAEQKPNPYGGGIWRAPAPPWWVTDKSAYNRVLDFRNVGGYVDRSSPSYARMLAYQPPAEYADLWNALPESWRVDLANRDPRFVQAYLQAVAIGNYDQARQIYQQSGEYRNAVAQGQRPPPPPTVEYRNAPYYAPSR